MNELGPVDEFESQVARRGGEVNQSTKVAIDLLAGSISGAASIVVGQASDLDFVWDLLAYEWQLLVAIRSGLSCEVE
jgi:hypothetical protein